MAELKVISGGTQTMIRIEPGVRIADALRANGFSIVSPCGGRGICGKCTVMLDGAVFAPGLSELKAGVRLACQAVMLGNAEVILPREHVMEGIEIPFGTRTNGRTLWRRGGYRHNHNCAEPV